MISQIFFALVTIIAFYTAYQAFMKIRRNILLGQDEDISGDTGARFKLSLIHI